MPTGEKGRFGGARMGPALLLRTRRNLSLAQSAEFQGNGEKGGKRPTILIICKFVNVRCDKKMGTLLLKNSSMRNLSLGDFCPKNLASSYRL